MIEDTNVGIPQQGYVHIKQSRPTKNHVTSIQGFTSHQILSLYVANCTGIRHRSFTSIDVVLTQTILYGLGWGTVFNPIFEIKTTWHSIYATFTINNDFTVFITNLYPRV